MDIEHTYNEWLEKALPIYKEELEGLEAAAIRERFYQAVPFGTGGMRGILGAGTNRMNIHTIRLVAEGLAQHIVAQGEEAKVRGVVIASGASNAWRCEEGINGCVYAVAWGWACTDDARFA